MRFKHLFLPLLLLGISSTILASSAIFAQDNIVLTIAMPDWMESNMEDEMFDEFEAAHPGVSVVFNAIASEFTYPIPPEYDIEEHLNGVLEYAQSGDVIFVNNYSFTPAGTRAGYFLDMNPLVSTDFDLDTNDFFPALWQSYQWDQAIWALPISASFNILVYRKPAFDEAGVPYPTSDWTFADFADAARALTQYDEDGDIELPGFVSFGPNYMLRSFLGHGFYDPDAFPQAPLFTDPELVALAEQWNELDREGIFGNLSSGMNYDFNEVPLTIQQPYNMMYGVNPDEYGGALLPGDQSGLELNGVALSAGTENPELAYELAKYMTGNIELVTMLFGMTPARRSLVGVEAEGNSGQLDIPDDVQVLLDQALEGALPVGELRFSGYIDSALNTLREDENMDAAGALQQMEEQAITDLQTAEARNGTTTVFVATPAPTPVLSSNEIALRVNVNLFSSTLPNRDGWDTFIADFAAEDPQVGFVELDTSFDTFATIAAEYDCFYMPYNALSGSNSSLVLSLDPFLSADFDFDANDMAPGIMAQVQLNGMTYGLPMTLQPQVMWYNSARFEEAGAFPPENGWTIDEFEDALRTLRASDEDDNAPFSGGFNANYILMLVAAYGAVPIDTLANPPVVNLIDPVSVEAIRQVLDLARDGYMEYSELGNFSGGGGMFGQTPIYDDTISPFSFQFQMSSDTANDNPLRLTTYPRGTQYTPVSYAIGSGYISTTAQNPDACYRFLSQVAQRPELLGGMPARLSLLDDPAFVASQPANAIAFYRSYFEILEDPNLVVLASNFGGGDQFPGIFVIQLWLYQAFDAYVLEDADLETELQQAQAFSEEYLECTADIVPMDESLQLSEEEQTEYFAQFLRCGVLVDPSLDSLFGGILDED